MERAERNGELFEMRGVSKGPSSRDLKEVREGVWGTRGWQCRSPDAETRLPGNGGGQTGKRASVAGLSDQGAGRWAGEGSGRSHEQELLV